MRKAKSLGAYADIFPVLDAAVSAKGAKFRCDDEGMAIRWRQRAYMARAKLLEREEAKLIGIPGAIATTPYDNLYIVLDGPQVTILIREPIGAITDLEGNPIEPGAAKPVADEGLLDFAKNFMEGKDDA